MTLDELRNDLYLDQDQDTEPEPEPEPDPDLDLEPAQHQSQQNNPDVYGDEEKDDEQ